MRCKFFCPTVQTIEKINRIFSNNFAIKIKSSIFQVKNCLWGDICFCDNYFAGSIDGIKVRIFKPKTIFFLIFYHAFFDLCRRISPVNTVRFKVFGSYRTHAQHGMRANSNALANKRPCAKPCTILNYNIFYH